MFDKKEFKKLLEKAIGNDTATEFAKRAGVNRTYISKLLNNNLESSPAPNILRKLAKASYKINYHELMVAAGYLTNEEKINKAVKENPDLQKVWQSMQERDDLQLAFKQLSDMSPRNIREILRVIQRIQEEESTEDS
jgi:transcriptional regulator with XRE-family HTH domain